MVEQKKSGNMSLNGVLETAASRSLFGDISPSQPSQPTRSLAPIKLSAPAPLELYIPSFLADILFFFLPSFIVSFLISSHFYPLACWIHVGARAHSGLTRGMVPHARRREYGSVSSRLEAPGVGRTMGLPYGTLLSVSFLFSSTKRRRNEFPLYQKVDLLLHIHGTILLFIGLINLHYSLPDICPFRHCNRPRTGDRIAWINLPLFRVGLFFPAYEQRVIAVHHPCYIYINELLGSHRQLVRGPLPGCQGGWASICMTIFSWVVFGETPANLSSRTKGVVCPPGVLVSHNLALRRLSSFAGMS
jgi:hypothetical protein